MSLQLFIALQIEHGITCLDDSLGHKYEEKYDTYKQLLEARNHSILAHGFNSIGKEKAEKMFDLIKTLFEEISEKPVDKFIQAEFPVLRS